MAFLFGRNKHRSNMDLVSLTNDALLRIATDDKPSPRIKDDLSRNLSQMRVVLQGTPDADVSAEQVRQLVVLMCARGLLPLLARHIHKLPSELRKDTQAVLSNALRFQLPDNASATPPAIRYVLAEQPEMIIELCHGYEYGDSATACGGVLREALKHESIAALILNDKSDRLGTGVFWKFFEWINSGAFEACADAFNTFRDILTKHKLLVSTYLETNFDHFFKMYNGALVQSDSYVTKRQSIKLLGELLLDRANYSVMTRYVASGEHLKIIMKLLRDDRRMINYEGFHVFKVFVANPNKSAAVQRILINNRTRLLKFLPNFLDDRTEDDQFMDEKSFLIRQIELLPPTPA